MAPETSAPAPAPHPDSTALVRVDQKFRALKDVTKTAEVMRANFGNKSISIFNLERIKLPGGGSMSWQIVDSTGELTESKSLTAVIPYLRNERDFWLKGIDEPGGGGAPPDCRSIDLSMGIGDNGEGPGEHKCFTCRQNQWGSKRIKGVPAAGKACGELWILFLLREGRENHVFPSVLMVKPGSMKSWEGYLTNLTSQEVPYWGAMHRLELSPATNKTGIRYAQIKPSLIRVLEPDEIEKLAAYRLAAEKAFSEMIPDRIDEDGEAFVRDAKA